MSRSFNLTLPAPCVDEGALGVFRFGRIADRFVVTNDVGAWLLLSGEEFTAFLEGRIADGHPLYGPLTDGGFLMKGLRADAMADRLRRKKSYLGRGPHLHIIITTLRCNQTCRYCHASRLPAGRADTDMTLETAKRAVDLAMQSPSPYLNFEFQGGEPTLNMPVIEFVVRYSREKNRHEKKDLVHSVVTNLTAMDERTADWLVDNDVLVCTSLDGPEHLHDSNRKWRSGASAHREVRRWMDHINRRYVERGMDPQQWHVDALLTTSRDTLAAWKEVIDLYVELGIHTIHLRPLNHYGFAVDQWRRIGYTVDEFLDFYTRAVDYIIELNRRGVEIVVGTAALFLSKMLTPDDPNFVDMLSPCGAGTGQVAYNYDGALYTCDEARMAAAMGDDLFRIGTLGSTSLAQMLDHPTVRALAVSSLLETRPRCESCWAMPYCGVCPIHNYVTARDFYRESRDHSRCRLNLAILTHLFGRLAADEDGSLERLLRRWTLTRPREPRTYCRRGEP